MSHRTLTQAAAEPSGAVRAIFASRHRNFADIAAIDWAAEPLTDVGRVVAGVARDCNEFYAVEHRAPARAIEAWLDRFSAAVHAAA